MQGAANPEDAVRRYLVYLEDPSRLIDQAAVESQTARAKAIVDPIERLHAYAGLERIRTVDGETLTQAFVGVALGWATEHSIPVAAFRELGVPDATLKAAGFELGRRGRTTDTARPRQRPVGTAAQWAKRVSVDSIQDVMRAFSEPFTLAEVAAKTGGSVATVRKAAEALCTSGELVKRGPDPRHASRGRAPILYGPPG
jgi:hypothetical protein